jgi:hypothetical protein
MSAINNRQHFNIVVDCHGIMRFISPPSYIRQNTTVKMRVARISHDGVCCARVRRKKKKPGDAGLV